MTTPQLSVLIPVTGALDRAALVARAVLRQAGDRDVQVIIASNEKNSTDIPGVQWIRLASAAALPRLLGAALSRARGEVIAVADGSNEIGEGWVRAALGALDGTQPVVGGAVDPEGLVTATDWAAYFTDYGRFMSPLPPGDTAELPGSNIAFRRCALQHGREFAGDEFWKSFWCLALKTEGYRLQAVPDMVVHYNRRFSAAHYLRHRFHSGRCFARMRTAKLGWMRRVTYLLGSPLLVGVFLYRTLEQVLPRRRFRRELARALPMMMLAMLAWAVGESMGYLISPGRKSEQT